MPNTLSLSNMSEAQSECHLIAPPLARLYKQPLYPLSEQTVGFYLRSPRHRLPAPAASHTYRYNAAEDAAPAW